MKTKKATPRHTIFKLMKAKDRILEAAGEK